MARELERRVVELTVRGLGARIVPTPAWLVRPGRTECGERWGLMRAIYRDLTGMELPDVMRPVERRELDAVLEVDGQTRILEVDETQHFNEFRALTLRHYAGRVPLAFDTAAWIARSEQKRRLEGGGFAKEKPPLFPGQNGRHRQRAFRDALADILPLEHGFAPTLRIAHFEVETWIYGAEAPERMQALLGERLQRN